MSLLELLILALATWRLAYAVTKEKCPFSICVWVRQHFPLGGLTTCISCASFWTAALMLALFNIHPLEYIVYVTAISGGALMLANYTGVQNASS